MYTLSFFNTILAILFFLNTHAHCENYGNLHLKQINYHYALKNIDIALEIIKNEIPNVPLKDFMIATILYHYLRFDQNCNLNAARIIELRENLISLMYIFNQYPQCWKEIEYHLELAKEQFFTHDNT